ncbi:MAG: aromatic ring-hydroxylating dioxygenase subunit alpha [Alphaproteobacteria bacterium]|nr:MAG: aromatic ring-hydroxylating dioxygenase subunit alpha [Alphaproteobacteria bacterium]
MTEHTNIPAIKGQNNLIAGAIASSADITRDRYISPDFMQLEADYVWAKVWNIGAWAAEIPGIGDYVVHQLGKDSILMVRQTDGGVKAFHNVCTHRGNRLVYGENGTTEKFACSYHGWQYELDGTLSYVQDADDFPLGNPCGVRNLAEIRCELWAGFVWYNMDVGCEPLDDFLGEVKEIFDRYDMDKMVRVGYQIAEIPCNWKSIHDNFCESYHLPTTHPELSEFFDDDYKNTIFELYDTGHNLMRMKGAVPSKRDDAPDHVNEPLAAELAEWGLDPADFEGRAGEARVELQAAKRALGPERKYDYFPKLLDEQLTDPFHCNLFPGTSITAQATVVGLQRAEPHPTDPNKCIYENWSMVAVGDGVVRVPNTPGDPRPVVEAERHEVIYGEASLGFIPDQDLRVASGQQLGFQSRGFEGAYLTGQESRVQQFHDRINECIRQGLAEES